MPKPTTNEGLDALHQHQQKLYELIRGCAADDSLTLDEMREELGVSAVNTVVHHLGQLEKKGYIRRVGDRYEALAKPVKDIVYLNLYATASCGPTGFFNDDNVIERVPFPAKQFRVRPDSFLVRAVGDSMEPKIHSGDFVLVEPGSATSGNIAVVVHDGEAKIKQLFRYGQHVVLQSTNAKYDPVVVTPAKVREVGVVRGVVRSFLDDDSLSVGNSRL